MSSWKQDELEKIAKTDDLHISPFREDGTPRRFSSTRAAISNSRSLGRPRRMVGDARPPFSCADSSSG